VATGVIARRTYGIRQARDLVTLNRKVDALQAERVRLDAEIRDASSLDHLAPILRDRLQMHIPADSMVVNLPRPRPQ
jgi:cell division protein FtsB